MYQVFAGSELLRNHDMEMVHFDSNWVCQGGCTLTSSKEHFSGYHSVMVSNRHHNFDGLAQNVSPTPGHTHNFTAVIKLLNLETGNGYQTVELMMACLHSNGHKFYIKFGHDPYVRLSEWVTVGGLHDIPQDSHSCHVYVQVSGSSVNYLVDQASLQQVSPLNTDWKTEANARIELIRKADISVSLTGSSSADSYEIELIQRKHEFAFGSAVGAKQIVDPAYSKYAQTFYENFEWAVLENALKWNLMESKRGHPDYDTALNALHVLKSNGTKVRGHNVFWGIQRHVPQWLTGLSQQEILSEIDNRTKGVVSRTRGLVEHWDVNNENLHGDWYEHVTGNPNITMEMFRDIHAVDPDVKLFLNEYGIMENIMALPIQHQAKYFQIAGVPIYGVGVQSHLHDAHLDIATLKGRLDTVAEAGLPIWITELTVASNDNHLKAQALTDILTLYFSHPAVEGVLLWGFWDGKIFKQETALFNGPNVTPNEAGRAYQQLFKTTWRTHENSTLTEGKNHSTRGFKGTYDIIVRRNHQEIKRETLTLGAGGVRLTIDVASAPSVIVG